MAKVTVLNPNVPGHSSQVDGERYAAMREAILTVTPAVRPGLTAAEMVELLRWHRG